MNPYKIMLFLIIFSFCLNFFTSIGIYSSASDIAVDSSEYSSFTSTDPANIITIIFSGSALTAIIGTVLGAVVGINPLLSGVIGFVSGIILTTTISTLRVFLNIADAVPAPVSTIIIAIVSITSIIIFISFIWFINQMISGPQEVYE